jgi:methyl-accepting chemotaxis protein
MNLLTETMVILLIALFGVGMVFVFLRLLGGMNLTTKLLLWIGPAVILSLVSGFLWARLGGVTAWVITSIIPPAAVLFGIGTFYFVGKFLINKLQTVADTISGSADRISSASTMVSSAGQFLAKGSAEQAASIEETSSSLEEMSSMTKQNADNASAADKLMKESRLSVDKANQSMSELTQHMEDISKSGEETSKIIKTIDEIAFQTNLLALNAAVEAARAGEAGAGFAVVANEVRTLAMRAADAAKNTSVLIEGTVKKVREGSNLVGRTNEAFSEVADSAAKVAGLVSEIAAASVEQAQGIGQINKVVSEMDKLIQQNTANAEESASASEEMTAQADQMKHVSYELAKIISGNGNGHKNRNPQSKGKNTVSNKNVKKADAPNKGFSIKGIKAKDNEASGKAKGNGKKRFEEIIPLDNNDFTTF